MTKQEMKDWIDTATYTQLLAKWRHASAGSPWFRGEIGDYYKRVMAKKQSEASYGEKVKASKEVGW